MDTLEHCALKLSLLSTELDIASLSLLRSFHNIMHREGTNFIYSVGRFFLYLLSLSLYSVILFTYRFFYRLCRWLILFGTNVGLLGGVDLDLTAGKHNIQVRGLAISADQVKEKKNKQYFAQSRLIIDYYLHIGAIYGKSLWCHVDFCFP